MVTNSIKLIPLLPPTLPHLPQIRTAHPDPRPPQTLPVHVEDHRTHETLQPLRLSSNSNTVEVFNKCTAFNCQQCVLLYNSLLFALCEVKLFYGAYGLIRRMIRKGFVPDKWTYAILVNAWCSSGKMSEARVFAGDE